MTFPTASETEFDILPGASTCPGMNRTIPMNPSPEYWERLERVFIEAAEAVADELLAKKKLEIMAAKRAAEAASKADPIEPSAEPASR